MVGICGAIHRSLLLLCLLSFVDLLLYADALSLIGFLILILTLSETLEACCQASIASAYSPTRGRYPPCGRTYRAKSSQASLREGLALVELGERIVLTQE